MQHHPPLLVLAVLGVALAFVGALPSSGADPVKTADSPKTVDSLKTVDPWTTLDDVRESLHSAGGTTATFVQAFRPAGFDASDEESGRVALDLPRCLRWDYSEPFPKSLLLCDGEVYSWAPDDKAGRRYQVDPRNEPGLDLLLLSTDDLRQRYRAQAQVGESSLVAIDLEPLSEEAGLRRAKLVVDPDIHRLVALEYVDLEGGTTTFEISGYRPIEEDDRLKDGTFTPPSDVRWTEE